jgi:hypothetical protein
MAIENLQIYHFIFEFSYFLVSPKTRKTKYRNLTICAKISPHLWRVNFPSPPNLSLHFRVFKFSSFAKTRKTKYRNLTICAKISPHLWRVNFPSPPNLSLHFRIFNF